MFRRVLLISGVTFAFAACGSQGPSSQEDSELVGVASLAIASVPTGVACIQITAADAARSVTDSFNVVAGQSTVLQVTGLPTGSVRFTGSASATSCAQVTPTSTPTWVGVPVTAAINSTTATALTLTLTPNGRSALTVNFQGDGDGGPVDAGLCNSVVCTAIDSCHVAGACNPTTGLCSNPLAPGAVCAAGQTCAAWFPDCDGDGFGNPAGTPTFSCSAPTTTPTCPAGVKGTFVANSGDCCDSDGNAHPAQNNFFPTPTACGSTTQSSAPFDYNCDGSDEPRSNGPTDCANFTCVPFPSDGLCGEPSDPLPADCNGNMNSFPTAACGQTWFIQSETCIAGNQPFTCSSQIAEMNGGAQNCH